MNLSTRSAPVPLLPSGHSGRLRRFLAAATALALGVGLGVTSAADARAASPAFCDDGTQPYAPVAEVEAFAPGTAVTGLSVTSGTTPDEFTGTYIGYIDNALGKDKDLLLFRLSSPVIDGTAGLKAAGIWSGMSGSPVYTSDGRLIGAVAYSLNYDNLPIAGVTPAEYMKGIGTTAVGTASTVKVTRSNYVAKTDAARTAGTDLVGASLRPVGLVKVAGIAGTKQNAFANRTLARTPKTARGAVFARSGGFLPAGVEATAGVPGPLVAGGSVAALYASGDALAGGIGTVTAVCGNTVWAFGHPMYQEGKTSAMMANVSTAMIVPDGTGWVGSYKQHSRIGAPLGMITQDRLTGIRGTVGKVDAFGIDVGVQNASGKLLTTYSALVSEQDLTGSAVAYLIGTAAAEQLDQYSAGTARVTWTIAFLRPGGVTGKLTNTQVITSPFWFPDFVGTPAAEDAWAITDNAFENVMITGIDVTLKLLDDDSTSYAAAAVQVRKAGAWKPLDGTKLAAGRSHQLRPVYKVSENGRPAGKAYGAPIKIKLRAAARKAGTFWFSAVNLGAEACETDSFGNIVCTDWADEAEYADFDEFLADRDSLQLDTKVRAGLEYRLKKGMVSVSRGWTGPGVVTGRAEASFRIRA